MNTPPDHTHLAPANHHADHPGFAGASGLMAAVGFLSGRDHAARWAMGLAALIAGDRLVDVGCGPGVAARLARGAGADVIGIDPAPVMLRVARVRWRFGPRIDWRIGVAESLPVDDGWASVVWSLSTVHHWADLDRGLAEARRVLAPGGRLVATERRILDTRAAGTASHGWTLEQRASFAAACRAHGFTDVDEHEHDGQSTMLAVTGRRGESC